MSGCRDYATGRLDLDLDEDVPRDALADCLASGWTAAEIAEELGLEGADDVARWCAYHDLPLPRVAQSLPPAAAPAVKVKQKTPKQAATPAPKASKQVGKVGARAPKQAAPTSAPIVAAAYARHLSLNSTAHALGISTYRVKKELEAAGVTWDHTKNPKGRRERSDATKRRLTLLAAAAQALESHGATLKELLTTLRASEGEIAWARRYAKNAAQETP